MKQIIIFSLRILCLILWANSSILAQQRQLMDKVVARVGDEFILLSEVEEQFSMAKERNPSVANDFKCILLENILVNKLLVNQAKIDSLYPKDEEIESQLNARIEKILDYMGGNVEQFVSYYGQTPEQVKNGMRDDMRDQIMMESMRKKVIADVSVTPSEVKTFFQNIPKDSLPYFNQEVEISEIIYKPKPNATEKAKAQAQLDELRNQIVNAQGDFATLAKKFSQDPGSGREGGDLGWAKRGKFVQEFEAQAYKLEEGQISPVFQSEFGFHILQLLERRGNSIHTRHILIKPEITEADYTVAKSTLDSVRREVLRDSLSFSMAVKKFSSKDVQSFNNDGRMTNPNSGNTIFETRELDPDTYFAIDTMKLLSISGPIEVNLPSGERYYRVVKLTSKSAPHKATLALDYSKIQAAAVEEKKSGYLFKFIEQKAGRVFVSIDPAYASCPVLEKWQARKPKP
jgi:peptidyl-prolyl cis-trans isomerase SurA